MQLHRVGIFGASGYAGIELTRLCASHPALEVAFLASENHVGEPASELPGTAFVGFEAARAASRTCDAVLLATPTEVSRTLVPELAADHIKIVDLSGAFRHDEAAVYGLTELRRDRVRHATLVANPGCYPTAASLPLVPLLAGKLVTADDIVVNAVSGISGAGRRSEAAYSHMERHDNLHAYKLLTHQHTPEIAHTLAAAAGAPVDVTFIPHLAPWPRGILATITTRLRGGRAIDPAALANVLREAYAGEPFIRVVDRPDEVDLHSVVGTNLCVMAVACEPRAGGRVIIVSAIDNLLKGAAGQAMQNLNVMLGHTETLGLTSLRRIYT